MLIIFLQGVSGGHAPEAIRTSASQSGPSRGGVVGRIKLFVVLAEARNMATVSYPHIELAADGVACVAGTRTKVIEIALDRLRGGIGTIVKRSVDRIGESGDGMSFRSLERRNHDLGLSFEASDDFATAMRVVGSDQREGDQGCAPHRQSVPPCTTEGSGHQEDHRRQPVLRIEKPLIAPESVEETIVKHDGDRPETQRPLNRGVRPESEPQPD